MIGRDEIAALIPHAGRMCLLDRVEWWDESAIRCETDTHRDPANPLRSDRALAAVHLIEYGAQAVAIHGGLMERARGGKARPGLLVIVRDVKLQAARVDDIQAPLTVSASRLVGNPGGLLYRFDVRAGERVLASGRVGVIHPDAAPG